MHLLWELDADGQVRNVEAYEARMSRRSCGMNIVTPSIASVRNDQRGLVELCFVSVRQTH